MHNNLIDVDEAPAENEQYYDYQYHHHNNNSSNVKVLIFVFIIATILFSIIVLPDLIGDIFSDSSSGKYAHLRSADITSLFEAGWSLGEAEGYKIGYYSEDCREHYQAGYSEGSKEAKSAMITGYSLCAIDTTGQALKSWNQHGVKEYDKIRCEIGSAMRYNFNRRKFFQSGYQQGYCYGYETVCQLAYYSGCNQGFLDNYVVAY